MITAALALDKRSHSWSDWYRAVYHHIGQRDEPTWDEFDAALTEFIAATDTLELPDAHYGPLAMRT